MTAAVILLHPADNVVVCRRAVAAGERIVIEGVLDVVVRQNIDLGHKIARTDLASGAKVIKYGVPIGSVTIEVTAGEWIHLHNMKSDYIDAHTRMVTGEGS
jgi:D-threo-aldose 1-dehydrogenase